MDVRARWTALVVLPAALVLASCSAPATDLTPTAVVAPTADCMSPAVLHDLGLVPASAQDAETSPTASPEPGKIPDTFVPVSVVVCTADGTLHDSSGTWLALTASHREGDLGPLVAALGQPSARRGGTCSPTAVEAPAIWLVDALGRAMRPTWPTDHCGEPSAAVSQALAKLQETDSVKFPVEERP